MSDKTIVAIMGIVPVSLLLFIVIGGFKIERDIKRRNRERRLNNNLK
jgi:uncharacterized protein YneF (UPF0154 family)